MQQRKPLLVPVHARLKVGTLREIAEIADREQRTISGVARMLIEEALADRHADGPRETMEATP